jgi:glutamate--cysteine ligase
MTVLRASAQYAIDQSRPLNVDSAYERCHQAALTEGEVGAVGLEIEAHLVNLDSVGDRVSWDRVERMLTALGSAAGRSAISLEPGGQLELSGPPAPDIQTAVTSLRHDMVGTRLGIADLRLGMAYSGADPLRPSRRINPRPRYLAMEQHFAATGRAAAAAVMMNSTAALQVNLQAGSRREWPQRVARAYRLGPTLVAMSASSPWLHGRDTGWKSARQRAWAGLDPRTCGPVPGCAAPPGGAPDAALDPASAWARYALAAPVTFVQSRGDDAIAIRSRVPFERWASGEIRLAGRVPTVADLDVHLTTLFPPVRLRGYLELRYLDMTAPRWWPAIAAVAATLMDDPVAADLMTEATEQSALLWTPAAREGLDNAVLADSARRCVRIAAERAPAGLGAAVADLAELVDSGRCPGDLLAQRIAEIGPHAAFEELAHA